MAIIALTLLAPPQLPASPTLLEQTCADCHNEERAKGKFKLADLGDAPTSENFKLWVEALDLVAAEEMPPEDDSELSATDRKKLLAYLDEKIRIFDSELQPAKRIKPRRLNNREFANSVRDALLLEDVGTHQPTASLIGDTLHHGFDTHGDTLGFSRFHLEQFLEAARKIVDAAILTGDRPESKRYQIPAERIARRKLSQNSTRPIQYGKDGAFDFLDPKLAAYFPDFPTVPTTGRYKITVRATGKDRTVYATKHTGYYHGDPIQLQVRMGDRVRTFDLPDEEVIEIDLYEWLAAGTRLELANPTDAFTQRGNGNFKFQYAIAAAHLKQNDPERYARRAEEIKNTKRKKGRVRNVDAWQNWTDDWQGARPQVYRVEIEGPLYETWPPKRQVSLLGETPGVDKAAEILRPIAERAWRRPVRDGELDKIVAMVRSKAVTLGDIEALKEGIVAVLISPAFLLLNSEDASPADRFAAKLSYFLGGTIPNQGLREAVGSGRLGSFKAIRDEIQRRIEGSQADEFLRAFPYAWLELNDINFMAPDPDHYRFYHRKRVSEDMVAEALQFFRHAIDSNLPVTELLSADYSFINADLAQVYGIEGVPQDSKLRKHTFTDGRRGGFLGMAAFLTATADSLSTSPIHRAVYVMENFMGIQPTPPPPNVEIREPDVRQAKTIKQILAAHNTDKTCAGCHKTIDPWGFAFENFDPTGAWRDDYTVPDILLPPKEGEAPKKRQIKNVTLPVDASAKFRNGKKYQDITEYRKRLLTPANRDRFVRCFITKLLTYANGREPTDSDRVQIDAILEKSAESGYLIVETIAAMVDSPLFRGN